MREEVRFASQGFLRTEGKQVEPDDLSNLPEFCTVHSGLEAQKASAAVDFIAAAEDDSFLLSAAATAAASQSAKLASVVNTDARKG